MDYNAINIFIDEAFNNNNIATYVDIQHIIDFYNTYVLISSGLSFTLEKLKILSNKILNIKLECKELYILFELVYSGLIIHCGKIEDRTTFYNYYAQWIWSRWILYKLNNKLCGSRIGR